MKERYYLSLTTLNSHSLRSRRERKAWGVSPRVKSMTVVSPRMRATELTLTKTAIFTEQLPPIFMGWHFNLFFSPGAHAPGVMLAPVPQASQLYLQAAFEQMNRGTEFFRVLK